MARDASLRHDARADETMWTDYWPEGARVPRIDPSSVNEIKLPPLPVVCHTVAGGIKLFDTKDMKDCATAAVLADRAERKPMTDAEIDEHYQRTQGQDLRPNNFTRVAKMVRAVEGHHGIKAEPENITLTSFYVTYSFGTNLSHCFSIVEATDEHAALTAVRDTCGQAYAFMYPKKDWYRAGRSQEYRYGLTEVPLQPQRKIS